MATYRFYFLDGANHIQEAEAQDFADDATAMENGIAISARHGGGVMEIWQGARLVHRQKATEQLSVDRYGGDGHGTQKFVARAGSHSARSGGQPGFGDSSDGAAGPGEKVRSAS
jgi:hypothetical protein